MSAPIGLEVLTSLRAGDEFQAYDSTGTYVSYQYLRPVEDDECSRLDERPDDPLWTGWVALIDTRWSPFVGLLEMTPSRDMVLHRREIVEESAPKERVEKLNPVSMLDDVKLVSD